MSASRCSDEYRVTYALPVAAFVFATILFYLVPRAEEAWIGPGMHRVVATGKSKQVNLDESGVIRQSDTLMFRVTFTDAQTGESIMLNGTPYFRGMPLPRVSIEDGKTTWKAPYDSAGASILTGSRRLACETYRNHEYQHER